MEDFTRRIAQIRADHEHGSRWLARQSMVLLRDLARQTTLPETDQLQQLHQAGRDLAQARPAMAALAGAVARILGNPGGPAEIARAADRLLQDYEEAPARITSSARPYLQGTVLTHSLSGTVLETLQACASSLQQVIVLEGRPLYEGRSLATTLSETLAHVTLITDAQADIFLPTCQAVVVGADSILADGGILNKAGTALLAWSARGHAIPFYVLAETLKISPRNWTGNLAQLEEQSGQEVWETAAAQINVRNFYFDHTPAGLITQLITEEGTLSREEIRQRADHLQEMFARLYVSAYRENVSAYRKQKSYLFGLTACFQYSDRRRIILNFIWGRRL